MIVTKAEDQSLRTTGMDTHANAGAGAAATLLPCGDENATLKIRLRACELIMHLELLLITKILADVLG